MRQDVRGSNNDQYISKLAKKKYQNFMHLYKLLFLGHRNLIKKITQTAGEEGRVREGKELHAVSTYSFGGQ